MLAACYGALSASAVEERRLGVSVPFSDTTPDATDPTAGAHQFQNDTVGTG